MKKLIILLAFIINCSVSYAIDPFAEINIPADKILHFQGSYLICDYLQDGKKLSNWDTFWAITLISYAKETIDQNTGGKFDITDIYANYCGWAFRRVFVVKLKF